MFELKVFEINVVREIRLYCSRSCKYYVIEVCYGRSRDTLDVGILGRSQRLQMMRMPFGAFSLYNLLCFTRFITGEGIAGHAKWVLLL
jgi:hypothetical protein